MPRGWLLHGAHTSNTPSSPILLSPPQDNPPGLLEEFPSSGNIPLISLGIPPLSHEALSQPNKAPQALESISQDLDSSQPSQQSLTFCKAHPN